MAHEDYTRNSRTTSGFGSQCKACHRSASSAAYFYRAHGLTPGQIAELRLAQHDRCAICGAAQPEHLDHDHSTGLTRQLLCQRCNQGLGLLRDDPVTLRAAAHYVERHRDPASGAEEQSARRARVPRRRATWRQFGMCRHGLSDLWEFEQEG
ncbi:endonuclease domain-containing protein [Geodermatophilus sp. SYSU D00691]